MQSLKSFYRIGAGPSSSHTMGVARSCQYAMDKNPESDKFIVTLMGSLSLTGVGHLSDWICYETLGAEKAEVIFDDDTQPKYHPNQMEIQCFRDGKEIDHIRAWSVGGGEIEIEGDKSNKSVDIYPQKNFTEIREYCESEGITLPQYVERYEGKEIWEFLSTIWKQMNESIREGLESEEEVLPGELRLDRRARQIIKQRLFPEPEQVTEQRLITSYAIACNEQNASGGTVVTAPTCGACGTVPAVLKYFAEKNKYPEQKMLEALAVAGVIGNVVKKNAAISGAEAGCQSEVGTATSMAAAAYAYLLKMKTRKIERAAEIALEHQIGLTCDPILGYVQVPCIERNAVAAMKAISAVHLTFSIGSNPLIDFDMIVENMYMTGKDMLEKYRETSTGGLALLWKYRQEKNKKRSCKTCN